MLRRQQSIFRDAGKYGILPLSWNYKDDWYLWQYLNRGELEGYSGGEQYIDLNVFNKDHSLEDLIVK